VRIAVRLREAQEKLMADREVRTLKYVCIYMYTVESAEWISEIWFREASALGLIYIYIYIYIYIDIDIDIYR